MNDDGASAIAIDRESRGKRVVAANLAVITLLAVLAGINRLAPPDIFRVKIIDAIRLTDFLMMAFFTPPVLICWWFIIRAYRGHRSNLVMLVFILGIFAMGIGYGMHDPANILHKAYHNRLPGKLEDTLIFLDDGLGHWTFFIGFAAVSLSGALAETIKPFKGLPNMVVALAWVCGLIGGLVIFLNMVKEETVVDLFVLGATAVFIAAHASIRGINIFKRAPLSLAMLIGYGGSSLATCVVWLV